MALMGQLCDNFEHLLAQVNGVALLLEIHIPGLVANEKHGRVVACS